MMRLARIFGTIALTFAVAAHADSNISKIDLARKLVKLLQLTDMFNDDLSACKRAHDPQVAALSAYKSNPQSFEGLTPSSSYWRKVVAVYDSFQQRSCRYTTSEAISEDFAKQFAEKATEEDMRASIKFYSSLAGQRLQSATREANKELQAHLNELTRQSYDTAQELYQKEMREVLIEFHRHQKENDNT
ncbi:MAG: DUF2059 domain-containing protein [Rudaea sp.]|uniref:DUF2059 domain-containing protein n=1 Tax=unclassified Rudaea TaxID=2627037 RepID=UPI0010F9374F|nr:MULTISPECIES: DUF2059 domain-containing protein [unclassified Rudaea]MBN8884600.1 DUF2059 domain-containing protein [Rudaea sp.]